MNEIFDRKLLKQNRKRVAATLANHSFLYHEIANRIVEDLQFFCDKFESALEIGARDGYLSGLLPIKNVIAIDSVNGGVSAKALSAIADDEFLPFKKESFDLIVSNLNLHHINQMPQFLLQVKNLLKPDGMFVASFFGEENLPELHKTIFNTENEIYSGVSPRMIPTIDVKTAAMLLQKAGFSNPVSNLERVEVSYENPLKLLKDLKLMGQGNIMLKRSRRFFTRNFLRRLLQNYHDAYQTNDGAVLATFEIITIVGFKK